MKAARGKRRAGRVARGRPKAVSLSLVARAADEREFAHVASPTALAAEALRTGLPPQPSRRCRNEIPHEDETIRVGDPDDSPLANEYVGEDLPGGSTPTPDQNGVDEIGRAYGLEEEDSGALRSAEEVLARRDRRRSELQAPGGRSRG